MQADHLAVTEKGDALQMRAFWGHVNSGRQTDLAVHGTCLFQQWSQLLSITIDDLYSC